MTTSVSVHFAVSGTLMRGLELNRNLLDAGAEFLREDATAPCYRLWSIGDRHPAMIRATDGSGVSVALEVWDVPVAGLAQVLLAEPPGLCVGKVPLAGGATVLGVVGEPFIVEGQREITEYAGWRPYVAALKEMV
ncbi:allophanate hydrolase-related protein [Streptomyces puniciscabiei]